MKWVAFVAVAALSPAISFAQVGEQVIKFGVRSHGAGSYTLAGGDPALVGLQILPDGTVLAIPKHPLSGFVSVVDGHGNGLKINSISTIGIRFTLPKITTNEVAVIIIDIKPKR